jgi:hypothetical protein
MPCGRHYGIHDVAPEKASSADALVNPEGWQVHRPWHFRGQNRRGNPNRQAYRPRKWVKLRSVSTRRRCRRCLSCRPRTRSSPVCFQHLRRADPIRRVRGWDRRPARRGEASACSGTSAAALSSRQQPGCTRPLAMEPTTRYLAHYNRLSASGIARAELHRSKCTLPIPYNAICANLQKTWYSGYRPFLHSYRAVNSSQMIVTQPFGVVHPAVQSPAKCVKAGANDNCCHFLHRVFHSFEENKRRAFKPAHKPPATPTSMPVAALYSSGSVPHSSCRFSPGRE